MGEKRDWHDEYERADMQREDYQDQLENLKQCFDALTASHAEVCATLEAAQARVAELEAALDTIAEAMSMHALSAGEDNHG